MKSSLIRMLGLWSGIRVRGRGQGQGKGGVSQRACRTPRLGDCWITYRLDPAAKPRQETISTLRCAARTKRVVTTPRVNEVSGPDVEDERDIQLYMVRRPCTCWLSQEPPCVITQQQKQILRTTRTLAALILVLSQCAPRVAMHIGCTQEKLMQSEGAACVTHVSQPCNTVQTMQHGAGAQEINWLNSQLIQRGSAPAGPLIRLEQATARTQASPHASGWLACVCCCCPVPHGEHMQSCDALRVLLSAVFFCCHPPKPGLTTGSVVCFAEEDVTSEMSHEVRYDPLGHGFDTTVTGAAAADPRTPTSKAVQLADSCMVSSHGGKGQGNEHGGPDLPATD